MSGGPANRIPDNPNDPRPKHGTKEYWAWYGRNKSKQSKERKALRALYRARGVSREMSDQRIDRALEFEKKTVDKEHKEAIASADVEEWVRGKLEKRLDPNQLGMSRWWTQVQHKYRIAVVNASRQIGKSFWALNHALAYAMTNPGAQVKYGATTAKQARTIIRPHFNVLLSDCPDKLKPKWVAEDSLYYFPHNNATISILACDEGYAESSAGQHAHLFIIDEGGQVDNLEFIVRDIALPMTLNTKGRVIIFSTPARSKGHSFKSFCDEAMARGTYLKRVIYDNPRLSKEEIQELCDAAGGKDSTTWRREYLVEHVTDEDTAVVPEATSERLLGITLTDDVIKSTRSSFIDRYVVVKPGWNPNVTGALFAHFDFGKQRMVIEDELVLPKMDSLVLAEQLSLKCGALWGEMKPFRLLGPVDDKLIVEMNEQKWSFSSMPEQTADVDIGRLRHSITHRRGTKLYIHERCDITRRQLENAVWDKSRKRFEHSKVDGRYELTSAAIYFRRELNERHNPTPRGLEHHPAVGLVIDDSNDRRQTPMAKSMRQVFGRRVNQRPMF